MRPAPIPPAMPPGHTWRSLMGLAFNEACLAAADAEAPVGAVLIDAHGEILASAHNQTISQNDPTAHAEILCLRQAGIRLGNYRLPGTILAVTLEPCLMCLGALLHARVSGIVFAAADPKAGVLVSNLDGANLPFSNHRPWVLQGVLAADCGALLKHFFLAKRKN